MRCELTIFGKPPSGLSRKDFTKLWRHLTSLRDRRFDNHGNSVNMSPMTQCITTKFIVVKLLRGEFTLMVAGKGYTVPELISQMETLYLTDCIWRTPIYPEIGPMVEVDMTTYTYTTIDMFGEVYGFGPGPEPVVVINDSHRDDGFWDVGSEDQTTGYLYELLEVPDSLGDDWWTTSVREVPRV